MSDNGVRLPHRQEIAAELANEHDLKRTLELAEELNQALAAQTNLGKITGESAGQKNAG